jgi:hypothetical protein
MRIKTKRVLLIGMIWYDSKHQDGDKVDENGILGWVFSKK